MEPKIRITTQAQYDACKEYTDNLVTTGGFQYRINEYFKILDAMEEYVQRNCEHCSCTKYMRSCCMCGLY